MRRWRAREEEEEGEEEGGDGGRSGGSRPGTVRQVIGCQEEDPVFLFFSPPDASAQCTYVGFDPPLLSMPMLVCENSSPVSPT